MISDKERAERHLIALPATVLGLKMVVLCIEHLKAVQSRGQTEISNGQRSGLAKVMRQNNRVERKREREAIM